MNDLQEQLEELRTADMLRTLRTIDGAQKPHVTIDGRDYLLLCSNNYLGLADHPRLIEPACLATQDYGTGSGASRLVSGSLRLHQRLEECIAAFKGAESALVFNSGYAANTGILQGLCGPDDVIFSDRLNHASIIDGIRLCKARRYRYANNDMADLEANLKAARNDGARHVMIATDGVFSMDGYLADLPAITRLARAYDALVMVDDCHATGFMGPRGTGTPEHFGVDVDILTGTLGKALGGRTDPEAGHFRGYVNRLPNGASHTISFNPTIVRDPEHKNKFKAFLRGYAENGGTCLQINMVDPEMLKDAQAHPGNYRHLLVRITGYNAYFTAIGKELQNEVIARVSHEGF